MLSMSCSSLLALQGSYMRTVSARASAPSMATPDEFTVAVLGDLHVSGPPRPKWTGGLPRVCTAH